MSITAGAVVGIVGGVISLASGLSGYGASRSAARATADSMNTRADRLKVSAQEAKLQAQINNLQLDKRFNDNASNQVVMQASGATSERNLMYIQAQDQEDLNWDKRFMTMAGDYKAAGYDMDAAELRIAAITGSQIQNAGATTSMLGTTANSLNTIGGSISMLNE